MDRRKAISGCILVQAGLGSVAMWAMLFTCLHGRAEVNAPACDWAVSAVILALAASVLASGILAGMIAPGKSAAASGALIGAGFSAAAFADLSALPQTVAVSAALGAAAGFSYVGTLDIAMRWYPEKKGIAAGAVLAGSAFGGLCWFRLGESLLSYMSQQAVLLTVGSCSAFAVLAGAFVIAPPPEGYVPPVWKRPENPAAGVPAKRKSAAEALRSPILYMIFAAMALTGSAAVLFFGNIHFLGSSVLTAQGLEAQLAGRIALLAAMIFAISHGLGTVIWGALADSIGFRKSILALCAAEALILIVASRAGGDGSVLIFASFAVGTAFGGTTALFPCAASEYMGERDFRLNYSLVFSAFLVAAAAALQVSGALRDGAPPYWPPALLVSGALPLAGGAVFYMLKKAGRAAAQPDYGRETMNDFSDD